MKRGSVRCDVKAAGTAPLKCSQCHKTESV
jgi:hypothetical protein